MRIYCDNDRKVFSTQFFGTWQQPTANTRFIVHSARIRSKLTFSHINRTKRQNWHIKSVLFFLQINNGAAIGVVVVAVVAAAIEMLMHCVHVHNKKLIKLVNIFFPDSIGDDDSRQ